MTQPIVMPEEFPHDSKECGRVQLAIMDTMELLSGKWKIQLIFTLMKLGPTRFMDLQRAMYKIGPKMLTKNLQELEINGLVERKVISNKPLVVEYEITPYGFTLRKLIEEIAEWGVKHREKILQD